MNTNNLYDDEAPKRPVNLTANADLLKVAKEAGINLSRTFEDAIRAELRVVLEKKWLEDNRDAIDSYNSRIEKDGIFGARQRRY